MTTGPALSTVDLVVSGIGLVSPRGRDAGAAARTAPVPAWDGWFDHRTELGRRGYKYLPAAAHYLLAATKRALADAGAGMESVDETARGVVIGTNSAASLLHAEMDRTVIETGSDDLSPALAPFFSINLIGSRLAPEHGLKGFNLTLTSPRIAGFEAIQAGVRAVGLGRAQWLLAAVTETPLDYIEAGVERSEEGSVALVFEPAARALARGGRSYGRCRVRSFFLPPSAVGRGTDADLVADSVHDALRSLGLSPDDLPALRVLLDDSPVGAAVARACGAEHDRGHAGTGCLEPLLQVAGALATRLPAVVVTASPTGNVAVAVTTPEQAPGAGEHMDRETDRRGAI